MASLSLMAYAIGLIGFMLIKVLAPGYFARQDTRTPVRAGIIALIANLILNLALVVPFKHAGLRAGDVSWQPLSTRDCCIGDCTGTVSTDRGLAGAGFILKIAFATLMMSAFLIFLRGEAITVVRSRLDPARDSSFPHGHRRRRRLRPVLNQRRHPPPPSPRAQWFALQ